MSRNSKLREVAAKLPPINKIGKNGRYMYDRHGQPIKVDHFQAMCDLKNALPEIKYPSIEKVKNPDERKRLYWDAQHKAEIQIIGTYTKTVLAMVRKRRNYIIARVLQYSAATLSVAGTILYLWLRHK